MPEGHTIHRLARDHGQRFGGQTVAVMSPQGRFSKESKRLSGLEFSDAKAHGKHLFYLFKKPSSQRTTTVHIHLGLYGKFRLHKNVAPEPRGAVRLRMIGAAHTIDLNGPNCCEIINQPELKKLRLRLGQDPLRNDADPDIAWQRISKSRAAIGTLLLNQAIIAGIGNVYRADILFLLGIHPATLGKELSREQFDQLWDLTVELLNLGVKHNRIITMTRDRIDKAPSRLTRWERLICYKKSRCFDCGQRIRKWELGARTMYACERCQT